MTAASHRLHFLSVVLPVCVLLLAPALLLWRVVFCGDVFLPADLLRDISPWGDPAHPVPWNPLLWDGMAEFYPWRLFYATTIHQGYLPLWNPHQFCGTPFLANAQSAVLYPFNLLFVLMPVARAFGASVWLHLALTGLLMYGFLRSPAVGVSRPAATLGALTWQLSSWQIGWLALPTFLCVSAWLPLTLWLTYRLTVHPTAGSAVGLGLTLGVSVLAGHLQIALYVLGLTGAYALYLSLARVRADRIYAWPLAACFALALIVMAGTVAPQILPTLELSRVSHRAGAHVSWSSYTAYTRLAVPPINILTLYLPGFFGNPNDGSYWGIGTNGGPAAFVENAMYISILGLALAFIGTVVALKTHRSGQFFLAAGIIALLFAIGTPLNALPYFTLPGFAQSGSPGRILVLWTFCAATLAAIGADALLFLTRTHVIRIMVAFGGAFLVALTGAAIWTAHNAPAGTLAANLSHEPDLWRLPVGILLGATLFYGLHRQGRLSAHAFEGSLALLVMIDLLAASIGSNRTCRPLDIYPVTPGIRFLQQKAQDTRIMPLNGVWSLYAPPPAVLPPNSATVYGLYDLQGYDSLFTHRYMDWATVLDKRSPAPPENGNIVLMSNYHASEVAQAGVGYLVSRGPLPAAAQYRLVFQEGDMFIYDTDISLKAQSITLDRSVPTRLMVHWLWTHQRTRQTISDQWYPGWQIHSDTNNWIPLQRNNGIFRVVNSSDTTSSNIEMRYLPSAFRLGLYALGLTLAGTFAVVCFNATQVMQAQARQQRLKTT